MVRAIIYGKLFDSEDGTWEIIYETHPPSHPSGVYIRITEMERLIVIWKDGKGILYTISIHRIDNILNDIICRHFGNGSISIDILTKLGIILDPL